MVKKVTKGGLIFLVLVFILETLVFPLAEYLSPSDTFFYGQKQKILTGGEARDILIFGDKRVLALNGKSLERELGGKVSVYNLSVPDALPWSHLYLSLKAYLDTHDNPEMILLSISPEIFGIETSGELCLWPQKVDGVPVAIHNDLKGLCEYIPEGVITGDVPKKQAESLQKYFPVRSMLSSIKYRDLIIKQVPLLFYVESSVRNAGVKIIKERFSDNRELRESLIRSRGQVVYSPDVTVGKKEIEAALPKEGKDPADGSDDFLEKFIELAYENDIPVGFFTMPVISSRYDKMKELGWFDYIDDKLRSFSEKYSNFTYYNILDIRWDEKFFGTWSLLNAWGAYRFSSEFKENIEGIMISTGGQEIDSSEAQNSHEGPIVFWGGSIVETGEWGKAFPDINVLNLGGGGMSTNLAFLSLDDVIAARPPKVFILFGANDITKLEKTNDIAERYKYVLEELTEELPGIEIYVISILPQGSDRPELSELPVHVVNNRIRALNEKLRDFSGNNIQYVDIHDIFMNKEGLMREEYSQEDRVHLSEAGYRVLEQALYEEVYETEEVN